jgi:hypothetical protein
LAEIGNSVTISACLDRRQVRPSFREPPRRRCDPRPAFVVGDDDHLCLLSAVERQL